MTYSEARNFAENKTWAFLELRPQGKIENQEQLDYTLEYARNCTIMIYKDNLINVVDSVPLDFAKGRYIHLGNWFGGGSFCFTFQDKPQDEVTDFTYGKAGRIDF